MGIRGLETYMEKRSNAVRTVNIVDIIHQYRRSHSSAPVIVVDGMSVMRFIYKIKNLPWIYGGQMKEYEDSLKEFICAFLDKGAELVFFFDGPCPITKRETWIKRRMDTLRKIYDLLDGLEAGNLIDNFENDPRLCVLPANLKAVTIYVAKKYNCKVYSSVRECDLEIAEYAFQNKCLAILAQDSDFIIFNAAEYYLSMKNFNLAKMTTLSYDSHKLASSLGITTKQLPLCASLLGNDVISTEELKSFHSRMLNRRGNKLGKWIDFPSLFSEVAHFVRPLSTDVKTLHTVAHKVFSDASRFSLIQESLTSYDYTSGINSDSGPPASTNKNWDNILKKVYELHRNASIPPIVYSVIILQEYSCSTCVEDYRLSDLPASKMVLKPLREKLYGVLLYEKPKEPDEVCNVKEMVVCSETSLDEPVYVKAVAPKVSHPGLLTLWSGKSKEESWILFGDIFGLNYKEVMNLPPHLIIPSVTLKYLHDHVSIENWELRAVISSVVLLYVYSADYLSKIRLSGLAKNTRPLRLFTLISRAYSTTIFIAESVGAHIQPEMIQSTNFQDGKLFHKKYNDAKQVNDDLELCDQKEVALQFFNTMIQFILSKENKL